jgi:hypothetical protein
VVLIEEYEYFIHTVNLFNEEMIVGSLVDEIYTILSLTLVSGTT